MGEYVEIAGNADHLGVRAQQYIDRIDSLHSTVVSKAQNVIAHEKWGERDEFTNEFLNDHGGKQGYLTARRTLIGDGNDGNAKDDEAALLKVGKNASGLLGIYQSGVMNEKDQDTHGGEDISRPQVNG